VIESDDEDMGRRERRGQKGTKSNLLFILEASLADDDLLHASPVTKLLLEKSVVVKQLLRC
jgi:hypothetical protein